MLHEECKLFSDPQNTLAIPSAVFYAGSKTMKKIHQYHSTKIFRIEISWEAIMMVWGACAIVGWFYMIGQWISH